MKTLFPAALILFCVACRHNPAPEPLNPKTITLIYRQKDIQKNFDTLYSNLQVAPGICAGLTEQALAHCYTPGNTESTVKQDVFSSMYLDTTTGQYDCVTTTTFLLADGTITATGVFNLTPGDTIAPDHDFPITGGSGAYRNSYGTYTRKYTNGVYHVKMRFYKTGKE